MSNNGHKARLGLVFFFFILLLLALIWRMLDLTVMDRSFLKSQGDARSLRTVLIPAHRGMITDRAGAALAVSTPVRSVWLNPKECALTRKQMLQLANVGGMSVTTLRRTLIRAKKREFLYLKRQLPPAVALHLEALHIPCVYFQEEFKRFYPEVDSTAQLLGFTNIDDVGIEGLELAYHDWLRGIAGKKKVVKDRTGRIIQQVGILKEPKPGNDLVLSIDRHIQYLAYHELKNTVEEYAAKAGTVVVVDTQKGEILAAANVPSFNPNVRGRYTRASYRNKAFTDLFEPGSVIKPLSIASALESKKITPQTIIDTRPGWMSVHGHVIRDVHNYGVLNVTGVMEQSSNVGVTKMTLLSPPEQLLGLFERMGLGRRTDSGYPGESEGNRVKPKDANPFVLATLSFGYGLSVTPVQLAQAYMVFANKGEFKPITLVSEHDVKQGIRVLDPVIAAQVMKMMEAVLEEGTGKSARVPGFRIAGKTGTARIAGKNGYESNRHIGSFVGIAPVSNPRLVVVVIIHEPSRRGYYGAQVAAPLFARVMSGALRILDVPPDKEA